MKIYEIVTNRKKFMPLLILADEQESMIDRYINLGKMYVLEDDGIKGECIITDEGGGIAEIKNLAVNSNFHRQGYGRAMIEFVAKKYSARNSLLQVGTGSLTVPFYEKCGFTKARVVKNFFVDNYDHPIYEDGHQLIDMIYLQRKL